MKYIDPFSNIERYSLNDTGMANYFADCSKDKMTYSSSRKNWYIYSGKIWKVDNMILANENIKKVMLYLKTLKHPAEDEIDELDTGMITDATGAIVKTDPIAFEKYTKQKAILESVIKKWHSLVSKMQNFPPQKIVLESARSVYPTDIIDFDKKNEYLNCQNATLDMKEIKAKKHNPAHLITKIANVSHNPQAKCERWIKFIDEIMCGNKELIRYLQKCLGYCISGDTSEECFFVFLGLKNRNGKDTLIETIKEIMGDYACKMRETTIIKHTKNDRAENDFADAYGRRLVLVTEMTKDVVFDEKVLKELTGNNSIKAKKLYENQFEYYPTFKLIITTNFFPQSREDSIFKGDRVITFPFNRRFEKHERDLTLKKQFLEEENKSGILNWLIDGYKMWVAEGLGERPQSINDLTQSLREENDIIGIFLKDSFIEVENGTLFFSNVYECYTKWCAENGNKPYSKKKLASELRLKDIKIEKSTAHNNKSVMYGYNLIIDSNTEEYQL